MSIPEITQHPINRTVIRNEPVTLDCRASESAEIEWFKDGLLVKTAPQDPQSHRILLPDGSLFFLRAMQNKKEQDAGVYWCVASNEHGVARSTNATLDIACKLTLILKFNSQCVCSHLKKIINWSRKFSDEKIKNKQDYKLKHWYHVNIILLVLHMFRIRYY